MRWRLGHPIIPGNKLHIATAFPRGTLRFRIAQKVFQRFEDQRTETSASWIRALQKLTFKHNDEKILCQVLGVRRRMSQAANEREDRPPVYLAKFRQRGVHFCVSPSVSAQESTTLQRVVLKRPCEGRRGEG